MAVSAPNAPTETPVPAAPEPALPTRRGVIRRLLLPAALATAAVPAASAVSRATRPDTAAPHLADGPQGTVFEETYRGRRIRGVRPAAGAGAWHVTVDDRPLHLMRRADGTWLTMVDHYRSYATPLDAARAAVDELGPGRHLRETGPHTGGGHGVHA
ncbi:tyrosinase family oxidase copper chaperone [Streptomyces griseoviridis]|uniref:Tyrosinase n=3 Tax=Streptomyces TaxID=1883 RepID=A0ABT9LDR8_STRGD|nr:MULTISPECIES: tyrosinase family oxidase copper chaperone [Streptomyces]MDP9681856.1 hypothetical protein [Streptomyces griseoviridis]GGS17915.1 tyrosinase [Streptomyces niveoruber]GGS71598.1 tyrosinase [Streptomyces griseoviridis]GGU33189.1 tyrosinase [Streptomyces daghestanicus]GHI34159.1 tyrosinase [Streptomyces daghestanicus]